MQLAIVRAITVIDEDGDAAWRVLAATTATHTLRQVLAEWESLSTAPPEIAEGVGVTSPLLFIALGPASRVRREAVKLRREAEALLTRLRIGESDLGDELRWLHRDLGRPGARFNAETWRALALQHLLSDDEPAAPSHLQGDVDSDLLFAFYAIPPTANPDELESLAARAIEAWLFILEPASADTDD